jgi:hypothetical protein
MVGPAGPAEGQFVSLSHQIHLQAIHTVSTHKCTHMHTHIILGCVAIR